MIIRQYLTKETYATLAVITGVLMLVFVSNKFVVFLSRAAAGKISGAIVFKILLLQIPYLLGLLLPVGLFLGILLAYGRLYVDSEMTVFTACGFSKKQLVTTTQFFALPIMLLVAILNLYVSPQLLAYAARLKTGSQADIIMQTLVPGRFQMSPDGRFVYYIESVSKERDRANNIFVAQQRTVEDKQGVSRTSWTVSSAEYGYQTQNQGTDDQFIVAVNGHQYSGVPGRKDFRLIKFDRYGLRMDGEPMPAREKASSLLTHELWQQRKQNREAMAELQWRIAMPLSVPVLALLAVPLSRVPPRRGRFAKLLPAILIYTIFANMMFVARDWLEDGVVNAYIGLWWLHAGLLLLALILLVDPNSWRNYLSKLKKLVKK